MSIHDPRTGDKRSAVNVPQRLAVILVSAAVIVGCSGAASPTSSATGPTSTTSPAVASSAPTAATASPTTGLIGTTIAASSPHPARSRSRRPLYRSPMSRLRQPPLPAPSRSSSRTPRPKGRRSAVGTTWQSEGPSARPSSSRRRLKRGRRSPSLCRTSRRETTSSSARSRLRDRAQPRDERHAHRYP